MNRAKRTLLNIFLGAITCILLVGLSTPTFSTAPAAWIQPGSQAFGPSPSAQNSELMSDLQEAESVLTAQGMAPAPGSLKRYVAVLNKGNVVPMAPTTSARGAAGAVLVGDRLIVRGDFSNLSSGLRDYAADPVNPPNPNITSAIHVHQGDSSQNGPFQYALTVTPNQTGLGGRFAGEYTLTSAQLQALADGKLYVDLHTQRNRAGELRGILMPL